MRAIVLHAEAELELRETVEFLESRLRGKGIDFLREFEAAVRLIDVVPEGFTPLQRTNCRMFVMRDFPYVIVYSVRGEVIRVFAIAHGSRRPGYWKKRLK